MEETQSSGLDDVIAEDIVTEESETFWQRTGLPVFRSPGPVVALIGFMLLFNAAVLTAQSWPKENNLPAVVPLMLIFANVLALISAIDLFTFKVRNYILFPAYAVAIVYMVILAFPGEYNGASPLVAAAISGVALWIVYYLIAVVTSGIGYGDVKLAGYIGIHLGFLMAFFDQGWTLAIWGGFVFPFMVGGVAGILYLLVKRDRKARIPFGPMMAIGAMAAVNQAVSLLYIQF